MLTAMRDHQAATTMAAARSASCQCRPVPIPSHNTMTMKGNVIVVAIFGASEETL